MRKPILIGELAKEHNGNITKAMEMIKSAKDVGFDWVKLQAYDLEDLNKDHDNYDRYVKCHLSIDKIKLLYEFASNLDIPLYASVFSENLIGPLSQFLPRIKVPSTYFSHINFVNKCIDFFSEVHISTGFKTSEEIKTLIEKYERHSLNSKSNKPHFYHCVSEYPTPIRNLKLSRIKDLGLEGFSYHSRVYEPIQFVIAMGVKYIELHFNHLETPKCWVWEPEDIRIIKNYIDSTISSMEDRNPSDDEMKNYFYFKKEFKTLKCLNSFTI